MMNEKQARRLAAMLTEQQRRDMLLVAWIIRTELPQKSIK